VSRLRQVEGAAGGVSGVEVFGTHRGAQPLAVQVGQLVFERLQAVAQIREGLVGRAVQPGGPVRVGPAAAGEGQADQRVGGGRSHPHAPGQTE
jgi:hypothetical protein